MRDRKDSVAVENEFRALYDAAFPTVWSYLMSRLGDIEMASDVAQETFAAVASAWPLDDTVENHLAWCVGVARHKMIDAVRRRERRRTRTHLAAMRSASSISASTTAAEARLHTALSRLPADQALALMLRYVDDLPVRTVGEHLGRSERAAESLLARARRGLRSAFEETADV